ncbi:hypothetical protein NLM59_06045 [Weeksellaceae bacterium KMM 9724]|uniref:hypothetical protein n=1 Tax=Profundicola chukchiensis TaxID=2961959 RepID=UPI00243B3D28|nr:hypothetical protein [Profundicola chukchiensis]MDG4950477.1 hypothetical protein [Profundicola chukchiensis]
MYKKILIYVLLFASILTSAQVVKFRAKLSSTRDYNSGSWGEFTEERISNDLIVLDFDKAKVTIYMRENIEDFDIIKEYKTEISSDGTHINTYKAVDKEGLKCTILFAYYPDNVKLGMGLFVRYGNFEYSYYGDYN